jgi:hypothetical protein
MPHNHNWMTILPHQRRKRKGLPPGMCASEWWALSEEWSTRHVRTLSFRLKSAHANRTDKRSVCGSLKTVHFIVTATRTSNPTEHIQSCPIFCIVINVLQRQGLEPRDTWPWRQQSPIPTRPRNWHVKLSAAALMAYSTDTSKSQFGLVVYQRQPVFVPLAQQALLLATVPSYSQTS